MQPTVIPNMDFNSDEFGPTVEEESHAEQVMDSVVRSLVQPVSQPEEEISDESYMSEVDSRLEIAKYFKVLANMVFEDTAREARIVENELKAWVKGRLKLLLSIDKPLPVLNEVKLPFNESEIKTIKQLATLSEVEINILKSIITKVTSSIGKEPVLAKPTPTVKLSKPTVAVAPPPEKRKPGRPPKEEVQTVTDPTTGEERVLKTVRKQRPPGMIPMPAVGAAMHMATLMKSQAAAAINENKALNRDDTHIRS